MLAPLVRSSAAMSASARVKSKSRAFAAIRSRCVDLGMTGTPCCRHQRSSTDRLLNGTPLRSDGKLTIVSLAAEVSVKRHVLTHRHTDLKDLFNARVKAQHSVPASEAALREQNEELHRKLDDMRAERDVYKQAADALARALNVLTTENDELRRRASRARDSPGDDHSPSYGPCRLLAEPACGWLDISGGVERLSTFTFRYQA
jgi:hypothetical protein